MKYIKPIALALIAVVLLVTLSASAYNGEGFTPGVNLNAAMKTYPEDTVMLSASGETITWGELYFLLYGMAMQYTGGLYSPVDWEDTAGGEQSFADFIKEEAISQAELALVFRVAARDMGLTLTDAEMAAINERIDIIVEDSESPQSLKQELHESGFISIDVFRKLLFDDEIQAKLPTELYGTAYDSFPEEKVADYAERNNFLRAKHILFAFPSPYDELTETELENAKTETYEKAQELLTDLKARENEADFADYFAEMALEHSEDSGSVSFPDGYLFLPYEMVEEFSSACEELGIGKMSGLVETGYGIHIILRLPLDYDMVPYGMLMQGYNFSLRQLAVFEDFDKLIVQWEEATEITRSRQLNDLDVAKLFAWRG